MRPIGILLFPFFLSNLVWGQSAENVPIVAPQSQDRFVIDLHNDVLLSGPQGLKIRPWSPGFNAYIMYDYPIKSSRLSVAFGYGISSFNLHLNGSFQRDSLAQIHFRAFPATYRYEKYKLAITYAEIPVEIRIRSNSESPWRLHLGAKIGYALSSHEKIIDDNGKRKFYKIDGLEPLRYGLTVRLGKGRFSAYGCYNLSPLFKTKYSEPFYPLSLGLSIILI